MKTPLQDLKEWVESNLDTGEIQKQTLLEEITRLMEKEKECIVSAYLAGDTEFGYRTWAEQYYEKTYKGKK
jgi:hypothetical protein